MATAMEEAPRDQKVTPFPDVHEERYNISLDAELETASDNELKLERALVTLRLASIFNDRIGNIEWENLTEDEIDELERRLEELEPEYALPIGAKEPVPYVPSKQIFDLLEVPSEKDNSLIYNGRETSRSVIAAEYAERVNSRFGYVEKPSLRESRGCLLRIDSEGKIKDGCATNDEVIEERFSEELRDAKENGGFVILDVEAPNEENIKLVERLYEIERSHDRPIRGKPIDQEIMERLATADGLRRFFGNKELLTFHAPIFRTNKENKRILQVLHADIVLGRNGMIIYHKEPLEPVTKAITDLSDGLAEGVHPETTPKALQAFSTVLSEIMIENGNHLSILKDQAETVRGRIDPRFSKKYAKRSSDLKFSLGQADHELPEDEIAARLFFSSFFSEYTKEERESVEERLKALLRTARADLDHGKSDLEEAEEKLKDARLSRIEDRQNNTNRALSLFGAGAGFFGVPTGVGAILKLQPIATYFSSATIDWIQLGSVGVGLLFAGYVYSSLRGEKKIKTQLTGED